MATLNSIDEQLQDFAFECDALELESLITRLESILRFARDRSLRGTMLDQRMHAAASDENWNKPCEEPIS